MLHPFLVPLYMVSLLLLAGTVYSLYPLKVKIYLIWVTLLFTTIIPFSIVFTIIIFALIYYNSFCCLFVGFHANNFKIY